MPIQCDEFESCKIKVQYVAETEVVKQKRKDAIKMLKSSKINVPGFRPGKASDLAIKNYCKPQIEELTKREMLSTAYSDTLFETKMKPIGQPQVLKADLVGSSFLCDMIFLKTPEFELKEYKGFDIPKPHEEDKPSDLAERMLQELRVRHGDVVPYGEQDFIHDGDNVTIDFACYIDGEVFEPFTKEGMLYRIGDNLIPDFDRNFLGMQAGEEKDFDILFTEGVPKDLIDKRAKFRVKVHMGTKTIPCPLDNTLAEKMNCKTLKELEGRIMGESTRQLQMVSMQKVNDQVNLRLISNHDIDVPPWLLLTEAKRLAAQQQMEWEKLEDDQKEIINNRARDGIKLSLIYDAIRDAEPESSLTEQDVLNYIKKQVEDAGQDAEEYMSRTSKDGSLQGTVASLRDEAVLQWVVSTCNIIGEEKV